MNHKRLVAMIFGIIISLAVSPLGTLADGKYPVKIVEQNMIVFPKDLETIEIVQIINFENQGESEESQLPIYLPKDYSNLQIRAGIQEEDVKVSGKGIIDTSGLDAGQEKQITLSYEMPMNKKTSQWSIEQSYVTKRIQVVIQPGVLSFIANDLITQSDLFEMNGQEFRRFTRLNLHPGEKWMLSFRLIVNPSSSNDVSQPGKNESIQKQKVTDDGIRIIDQEGIGYGKATFTITIIIIAFSAALIGLKRDLQRTIGIKRTVNYPWLTTEKEVLLEEIAQLENDYQLNLVGKETYETTKEKLRGKLIQITTELKKRSIG